MGVDGGVGGRTGQESLCFIFSGCLPLYFLSQTSVNISMSLYLSLCHSLKDEGKTHILLLLLPLQIFPPLSSQEVSHLPLCWLSGEAQWC